MFRVPSMCDGGQPAAVGWLALPAFPGFSPTHSNDTVLSLQWAHQRWPVSLFQIRLGQIPNKNSSNASWHSVHYGSTEEEGREARVREQEFRLFQQGGGWGTAAPTREAKSQQHDVSKAEPSSSCREQTCMNRTTQQQVPVPSHKLPLAARLLCLHR